MDRKQHDGRFNKLLLRTGENKTLVQKHERNMSEGDQRYSQTRTWGTFKYLLNRW